MKKLPLVFLGLLVGTLAGSLPIAFASSSGLQNETLNIVILVILFGLGVPWSFGVFFVLLFVGNGVLLSYISMPFIDNTSAGWAIFGKAVIASMAAGMFLNGVLLYWLRFRRADSQKNKPSHAKNA